MCPELIWFIVCECKSDHSVSDFPSHLRLLVLLCKWETPMGCALCSNVIVYRPVEWVMQLPICSGLAPWGQAEGCIQ